MGLKSVCKRSFRAIFTLLVIGILVLLLPLEALSKENQGEKLYDSLQKMFPNKEAIIRRYGNPVKQSNIILTSIHDDNSKIIADILIYPNIEFRVSKGRDDWFWLISIEVKKPNLLNFLGIDIGSTKEAVIKKFGQPQAVKGNRLLYNWEDEDHYLTPCGQFDIKDNKVSRMLYIEPIDDNPYISPSSSPMEIPCIVTGDAVRLRDAPSKSGKIIGKVDKNTQVIVVASIRNSADEIWYQIKLHPSGRAWISSDFVSW